MGPISRLEPRRVLGRTGVPVTRLGIGDVADRKLGLDACVAAVVRALDHGLDLVDTAPNYENGFSEEILGHALAGRRGVFVVDKLDDFASELVRPQVETGLARMKLERLDLVVFHAVKKPEDWRAIAARGGAMETLGRLQGEGLVRFRGISSHNPDVLRAAILSDLCDVVMFPVGPSVDERYVTRVLPLARSRGVGTIGFKTFAAGKLLADPARCVRYTLSLDPDVALLGMSTPAEVDAAVAAAQAATPMDEAEERATRVWARELLEGKGPFWWNPEAELPVRW
jgi:aryl-alcohol dehydrogenase-like predicted oxidoreductase